MLCLILYTLDKECAKGEKPRVLTAVHLYFCGISDGIKIVSIEATTGTQPVSRIQPVQCGSR